jgi:hypothetical protein
MKNIIQIPCVPWAVGGSEFIIVFWKIDPWAPKKIAWVNPEIGIVDQMLYVPRTFCKLIKARHMMPLIQEVFTEMGP